MYIKKVSKKNGKTNKEYHTLHVVESVQTEKGPRQRLLANLGPLDVAPADYKALARAISSRLTLMDTTWGDDVADGCKKLHQESLFGATDQEARFDAYAEQACRRIVDEKRSVACAPSAADSLLEDGVLSTLDVEEELAEELHASASNGTFELIDVASVRCSPARSIGAESVCHAMWGTLGIDGVLRASGVNTMMRQLIETAVIGRLIAPASERRSWEWAQKQSAVFECITDGAQVQRAQGSLSSFYRAGDELLRVKDQLETHLSTTARDLFDLPETLCLFDLTNTFFEGTAANNDKARRGRSKEKRSDCPLVSVALLIDEHGFPKYSHTYPGNVSEPSTLADIIGALRLSRPDLFIDGRKKLTVLMDRGIATKANLKYLREHKLHYIVAQRGRAAIDPARPSTLVRDDAQKNICVRVQKDSPEEVSEGAEEPDTFLTCVSTQRRTKESSMRSAKEEKFLAAIKALHEGLSKPRTRKQYAHILERVGRLKERYSSVAQFYSITVVSTDATDPDAAATSVTHEKVERYDDMLTNEGSYKLRTNRSDLSEEELWETYITLTNVERSFRYLKSDLGLRPCHHQNEDRADAHIFITIIAYHIMHAIEHVARSNGETRTWATLKRELASHARLTVSHRTPHGAVHTRLCTSPSSEQRHIYKMLNITKQPLPRTITRM